MKRYFVLIATIAILGACGKNESGNTTNSTKKKSDEIIEKFEKGEYKQKSSEHSQSSSSEVREENPTIFGLNDEALIGKEENNPVYGLKIIKATKKLSETSDFYTDGKPDNTIEVTYEYKNYSHKDPLIVNSQFINAYNQNGLAGETKSIMIGQNKVSEGKSARSTTFIVFPDSVSNMSEVEIEYLDDFSLGFTGVIKFKVNLE